MHKRNRHRIVVRPLSVGVVVLVMMGCRQNLLGTQNSVGQLSNSALESPAGAQGAYLGAQTNFIDVLLTGGNTTGLLFTADLLSDELMAQAYAGGDRAFVDGRYTTYSEVVAGQEIGNGEIGDEAFQSLLYARSQLLLTIGPLFSYAPPAEQSLVGEAYALAGYAELYMTEDYCPGVALDRALPGGGIVFGTPLTTDSLLGTAIGHFDSALKYAYQNDTVINLASVGLGRAWLDRDSLTEAAQAVANVPLNFVYNLQTAAVGNGNVLVTDVWAQAFTEAARPNLPCVQYWMIADREGGVGMNYISAEDPRLVLVRGGETCDTYRYGPNGRFGHYGLTDSVFNYPIKFGPVGQSDSMPIATGAEAALIAAEAAGINGGYGAMLNQLQTLRQNAAQTYLQVTMPMLTTDSLADTGAEAISILFRERAFWLFGLGTRLGDMRREARQYASLFGGQQNAINAIYPNGPYGPDQISPAWYQHYQQYSYPVNYGTDVDLELPTEALLGQVVLNPAYKGCTQGTTVP